MAHPLTSTDGQLRTFVLDRITEEEDGEPGAGARARSLRAIVAGSERLDDTLAEYGVAAPFDGVELLRWLALPYADHADFQPAWHPEPAED